MLNELVIAGQRGQMADRILTLYTPHAPNIISQNEHTSFYSEYILTKPTCIQVYSNSVCTLWFFFCDCSCGYVTVAGRARADVIPLPSEVVRRYC